MTQHNSNGSPGLITSARNRERIRAYMLDHLGATNAECGQALGLSDMAVGRHVMALKAEWKTKPNAMALQFEWKTKPKPRKVRKSK